MKSKKKKEIIIKKQCFLCYNFTFFEFDDEQIKLCAENWLCAENCPNYTPLGVEIFHNKEEVIIIIKEVKK